MTINYRKKSYTQDYLRQEIKNRFEMGIPATQIQKDLGIGSSRTIYKWANASSLENKPSTPHNIHRKYDFYHLYALYAYKKYLNLPLNELLDKLEEKEIFFKRSSASYYLNQWKLTKKFKSKRQFSKFKDYDVGYLHIDITYGPKIDGKKYYIYVAIDRKTRLIYLEVHANKKAETAANFFRNAIDFFPFYVEYILTDNEKEFSLKNHKGKYDLEGSFDKICKEFGIEHRLTQPYSPWTNGMVEKANDTIKNGTINKNLYSNIESMIEDIIKFMVYYNLERRHSGIYTEIRKKTPYDALEYYYNLFPDKFKEKPKHFKQKLLNFIGVLLYLFL